MITSVRDPSVCICCFMGTSPKFILYRYCCARQGITVSATKLKTFQVFLPIFCSEPGNARRCRIGKTTTNFGIPPGWQSNFRPTKPVGERLLGKRGGERQT